MPVNRKVTLLLADKHDVVRHGIRLLLEAEPDFSVVGEASEGLETLRLVASLKPDVLVTCPEVSGLSGFEVARQGTRGTGRPDVMEVRHDQNHRQSQVFSRSTLPACQNRLGRRSLTRGTGSA